jgi:hypothetical protein
MSRQLLISGTIQQLRERAILWLEMRTPEHKQNYTRNQLQKSTRKEMVASKIW